MRTAFKYLPERAETETRVGEPVKGSPLTLPPSLRWAGVQTTKHVGSHIEKSLKALCFQGFFIFLDVVLALWLALFLRQTLDEPLHTVNTSLHGR